MQTLKRWIKSSPVLFLIFLLLHLFLVYTTIANRNLCCDESSYFFYAKRWLLGKPERIQATDDSKSPVVAIALIPRITKQLIHPGYKANDYGLTDTLQGRYMMVIYSLLCALYLYKWSKKLLGDKWWYSLLFFVFDPLMIAHAGIVGSDVAVGLFVLASLYHLSEYYTKRLTFHFCLCCIFTALGIVAKVSCLYLVPLLAIISGSIYFYTHPFSLRSLGIYAKRVCLAGIVIIFIINCSYYFKGSFTQLSVYNFQSDFFISRQRGIVGNISFPIPLPTSFIQSIDMLKKQEEIGGGTEQSTYGGVYVAGLYKQKGGFWFYYLYTAFYKLPLLFIVLLLAGVIIAIKKIKSRSFNRDYILLITTIGWFLLVLSLFNAFQTSLRHILIIMPLVYISLAASMKNIVETYRLKWLQYLIVSYLVFIAISIYPYYFAYKNELLAGDKHFYKKIIDASIDYDQNKEDVEQFVRKNTWIKKAPILPDTGWFIIRTKELKDFSLLTRSDHSWLKSNFTPKYILQGVNLIYYVSKEDLNSKTISSRVIE